MPNPLKCCNCGKKIADEVSIRSGTVKITCKCGTVNEVKAEVKPRENYQVKTLRDAELDRYKGVLPVGFNCAGDAIAANGKRLK